MFKRFLILFFLVFLVSSCGDDTSVDTTEGLTKIDQPFFSINIPSTWELIENTDSVLPKPNTGDIELVVSSITSKNGFKNNMLILSQELTSFTTSSDFSMLNNIGAEKDYLNYVLLEKKNFVFDDGEESLLYIFEAKYNYDSPELKFLQTSHICNQTKAFFFTIAIPTSVTDTSKYEQLLQSFECKESGDYSL